MHTYIHTYMHTYTHTHTLTYVHTYVRTYVLIRTRLKQLDEYMATINYITITENISMAQYKHKLYHSIYSSFNKSVSIIIYHVCTLVCDS